MFFHLAPSEQEEGNKEHQEEDEIRSETSSGPTQRSRCRIRRIIRRRIKMTITIFRGLSLTINRLSLTLYGSIVFEKSGEIDLTLSYIVREVYLTHHHHQWRADLIHFALLWYTDAWL